MATDVVILAAGRGTRMKSRLPKVLHCLAGRPLLQHVVDAGNDLKTARIIIVTGHESEKVRSAINGEALFYVEQKQPLGTAHAVQQAVPEIRSDATVLILYGDVPLIQPATIQTMVDMAADGSLVLLTVLLGDPSGYGRIIRDQAQEVVAIVEEKDASQQQLDICEVNTGVMALPAEKLKNWLPVIDNKNAQQEYYLTDLISLAHQHHYKIKTLQPLFPQEVEGVNNRSQLSRLERYYQRQHSEQLMLAGVTIADPDRVDVRGKLTAGIDNYIDVNVVFEGDVQLGNNVSIGPNCLIINSRIADGAEIKANSIVEGSLVGPDCVVGPFARLRAGTEMAESAKIGNFVETKNSSLGKGTKINHLSYVGDACLGANVNIGAGTITCNYDGLNKHRTTIGDNAFIGSNTSLVAPVTIGKNATVGAGSTITCDVPDGELGLTRAKQQNIEGWKRPGKNDESLQ
ncbi:bifunctional UDP-N-acetylglucosamine diphosphorylase/glucosamine-1-phosphate N-acetyltransferase GlmU [Porticoccus sp.]|uniref:bifunctional UDP-N-acetylglucosamine diphosphorylase/glucosamine-1-phosphate N-acetyltransferase GlmU n=1 Tax=Porticoccus sp. TaxID=2024853 RepID=UPI003F698923